MNLVDERSMKLEVGRKFIIAAGIVILAFFVTGGVLISKFLTHSSEPEAPKQVLARHVINAHYLRVDERAELVYAGLRGPYSGEPLFEEAKRFNEALVEGKLLNLDYEKRARDRDGRLVGYAFLDGKLVNEEIVRAGYAFVQLAHGEKRYKEKLLAAQADARTRKAGIWARLPAADESGYVGDSRQAIFHRPSCKLSADIKPERRVAFKLRDEAYDKGYAPCRRCLP